MACNLHQRQIHLAQSAARHREQDSSTTAVTKFVYRTLLTEYDKQIGENPKTYVLELYANRAKTINAILLVNIGVFMTNRFSVISRLVAVLLLGTMIVGCASTRHGIEITNVQNISEIYIRNAGATNWGSNMVRNMRNINKSLYSEMVDIRVVDTNRIVYSKYNVPFDNAAFAESGKTSSLNLYVQLGLATGGLLVLLYFLLPTLVPKEEIK